MPIAFPRYICTNYEKGGLYVRRAVTLLMALVVLLPAATAYGLDADELQLYMGDKVKYVWKAPEETGSGSIGEGAGEAGIGSPGYIFTTKETPELIAQALSDNHPRVTAGFIRQLPMRDLQKLLAGIKSAADILTERGREDLLALAYLGGYVAPEHEYIATDPEGDIGGLIPKQGAGLPGWANNGDLGQVGDRVPGVIAGELRLRSVFGESYTLGAQSFGAEETVFDAAKDSNVQALFNGFISYVGVGYVELRSYDQRVTVRYAGVEPIVGTVIGKTYAQGERLGTTAGYALGVSLRVDDQFKNLLEVYSQTASKQWFDVWDKKNPGLKSKLLLGANDSNYHFTNGELNKFDPNSYTNPEMYGVDPSVPPLLGTMEGETNG
ncbi:hypothetical protein FACS1894208_00990 [Clostridia bacterium]|nr:hypothetical protein FACS1894208_00990 [Clostridia bacterium]